MMRPHLIRQIAVLIVLCCAVTQADSLPVEGGLVVCIGGQALQRVAQHWERPGCVFHCLEVSDAKVARLREKGEVTLYHCVLTESPHASVAYPAEPSAIQRPELVRLWESTSPLLGSPTLAARKATVTEQSRGLVINGRFDLLLDGIEAAAGTHHKGTEKTEAED